MKAGATSEHKGDIYEPGAKCKGKGKEESSKVILPVNEEVRNWNIGLFKVLESPVEQKFMLHMSYVNLLFSSMHIYTEFGSLMWEIWC